ncbi:MAG: nicotinate-nucleotide adenylyltransferase [bacterium]|nr:nicotinate-nucleotide adenylyltransferase [bacterium]
MAERVGIFGGTFNPIHMGHLITAEEIRQQLALDRIVFIPSAQPPHKPALQLVGAVHRLAMARLAVSDNRHFQVSSMELDRQGPSYSVDTVAACRKLWGPEREIFFILGIDAFLEIGTWHQPERLPSLCNLVVISRPDYPLDGARATLAETFGIDPPLEGREVALPGGHRLYLVDVLPIGISSSLIRERICAGRSAKYLLPDSVESYILSHDVYRSPNIPFDS